MPRYSAPPEYVALPADEALQSTKDESVLQDPTGRHLAGSAVIANVPRRVHLVNGVILTILSPIALVRNHSGAAVFGVLLAPVSLRSDNGGLD